MGRRAHEMLIRLCYVLGLARDSILKMEFITFSTSEVKFSTQDTRHLVGRFYGIFHVSLFTYHSYIQQKGLLQIARV